MSFLSPVAIALLNTIQSATKTDDKNSGESFLSLLESGGKDASLASEENEKTLLDALYAAPDEQPVMEAPVQVPTAVFVGNKASNAAPRQQEKMDDRPKDKPDAVAQASEQASPKQAEAAQPKSVQPVVRKTSNGQEKQSVDAAKKPTQSPDDVSSEMSPLDPAIAEKLRAKIKELSDILSSLAGMLGVSGVQVSVVQVTQMRISVSQQTIQTNQPFVDLSNRFDQLMAAISTGQNLPSDFQQSLQTTFGAFKTLMASFLGVAHSAGAADGALATYDAAQASLGAAIRALPAGTAGELNAGNADTASLGEKLQQLQSWLESFHSLSVQKQSPVITNTLLVEAMDTNVVPLSVPSLPKASQFKHDVAADTTTPTTALTSAVAGVVPAPIQSGSAPAAAVVPGVVENASGAGANLSDGEGSGQGGDRSSAGSVQGFTGTSSASNTASSNAPSFSKALKEAAHAPVSEQVAFNIKTAVKNGDSKIQIHLDPVELGKLHIKMDISSDGKASNIVITADNKATLDLLQRDMRGLENALSDAGLKTDSGSLSFNLRGGDQGQDDGRQQARTSYIPLLQEEDELAPLAVVSRSYVVNLADGLDIKI